MSKAIELAEQCGATECTTTTFAGQRGFAFCREEVEAFYHAARAEALREAAEKNWCLSSKELRAMADRKGK